VPSEHLESQKVVSLCTCVLGRESTWYSSYANLNGKSTWYSSHANLNVAREEAMLIKRALLLNVARPRNLKNPAMQRNKLG
jgi:hypothetical protein